MTIADALIKQILADARWNLPVAAFGDDQLQVETLIPEGIFEGALDLDVFSNREPDSLEENGSEIINALCLLGTYHHMHSPGLITLYRKNIEAYWRSLLKHAHRQFPFIHQADAERVLHVVVQAVYRHERFHYICDFCRRLFGSSFDRWHEEALAVAAEWQWLKFEGANSHAGRLHPMLRRIVVDAMFRHTSKGYRDWRLFANASIFSVAVSDYVHPQAASIFTGTGFDFGRWVLRHVADDGNKGWEEKIG